MTEPGGPTISRTRIDAVVFDVDGVVTKTADVHAAAWKRLFDAYLAGRARETGEGFEPFDEVEDYHRYVDGKPRYDGVRDFLASRGITLPEGGPDDPPDRETVCGLGNRKNDEFLRHLRERGVEAYPTTVELIRELRAAGVHTAVISASQNAREVLEVAGVAGLFDARVDGVVAGELGLPGKPDPAVFVEAARRVGAEPSRAAVVEDALVGVEAGRRGGFALVIGVDRTGHADALKERGADIVVADLEEVGVESGDAAADARPDVTADPSGPAPRRLAELPSALDSRSSIAERLRGRRPAVFLDYDGTLTPIVDDPAAATLSKPTRASIRALGAACPVAIVSGRDLRDVQGLVGLDDVVYAGSHGFEIEGPGGLHRERGEEFLPALDRAEEALLAALGDVPGAQVERKRFAIAIHYRRAAEADVPRIEAAVADAASRESELRRTAGKKVFELRPALEWDKGRAVLWILEELGLDRADVVPFYVGDDATDEDPFRALEDRGIGVVVRGAERAAETWARYGLGDTDEVRDFLDGLRGIAMEHAR